jgi:O-antigen/teichoic acid export membrane protein
VRTREDVIPYLALTIAANLSSQAWNFDYMLRKEVKFRFKHLRIRKHLNGVLVLFTSNIAISIYTMLSTLLLGFMSDYTQVGYYTSAVKVSRMILPIVVSMSPVMVARINTIKGDKNSREQIIRMLNNSFGYMMMLAVPTTVGLMVVSQRFVPSFFGAEFIPATASLQLLSLLILIIGISNLFGTQILIGMGYEKKFLVAVLFGTVSNFSLNLLLVRPYGSFGASIAVVVAEILVTLTIVIFASKIIPVHIKMKSIFQPIVAALPIMPISAGFNHVMDTHLSYLSTTVLTSIIVYIVIMTFILKTTTQILYFTL